MKRTKMKKALILTALISSMLFSFSCGGKKEKEDLTKDGTFAGLSVGMEREIEKAKGEEIVAFFGEYDGVYAVMMEKQNESLHCDSAAGIQFYYKGTAAIEIYKGGRFYSLYEGYKAGILTEENLLSLRGKYYGTDDLLFETDGMFKGLSVEKEQEIETYRKVPIAVYLGEYDGKIVYIRNLERYEYYTQTYADCQFIFKDTDYIYVYENGIEYSISAKTGLLSDDEIKTVHQTYKSLYPELYEENHTDGLFDQVFFEQIRTDYLATSELAETIDDVVIENYFGKYGRAYFLDMAVMGAGSADMIEETIIAGIEFHYDVSSTPRVYYGGRFYDLTDAYAEGIVTSEDLWQFRQDHLYYKPHALDGNFKGLPLEKEREIEKAKGEEIVAFFGEYDGVYAVMMEGVGDEWYYERVVGTSFHYMGTTAVEIYKNGEFYSLQQAYDSILLSAEEISEIRISYYAAYPEVEKEISKDGTFAGLSVGMEREIEEAYYLNRKELGFFSKNETVETVQIDSYFGTYGQSVAVMINIGFDFADMQSSATIEDIKFVYPTRQKIKIYYDGKFYSLWEAYHNEKLINKEQLCEIQERYYTVYPEMRKEKENINIPDLADDVEAIIEKNRPIKAFFGEYNGAYVYLNDSAEVLYSSQTIAECQFIYIDHEEIFVYRAGEKYLSYSLGSAVREGLLKAEDVQTIFNLYRQYKPELYTECLEKYFNKEIAEEIRLALLAQYFEETYNPDLTYTVDDMWIREYYGKYGKAHFFCGGNKYGGFGAFVDTTTIDGVSFEHSPQYSVLVYYNGEIYDIEYAYEMGVVTKQDVLEFWEANSFTIFPDDGINR